MQIRDENIRDSSPPEVFSGWTSCSRNVKRLFYGLDNRGSEKIFTEDKFRVSEPIKFRNGPLLIRKLE